MTLPTAVVSPSPKVLGAQTGNAAGVSGMQLFNCSSEDLPLAAALLLPAAPVRGRVGVRSVRLLHDEQAVDHLVVLGM